MHSFFTLIERTILKRLTPIVNRTRMRHDSGIVAKRTPPLKADDIPSGPGSYRRRARAKVYLKDPLALSRRGTFPVGEAIVSGDTSIAPGPTSSRFVVVDYDASADRVYAPTKWQERVEHWSQGQGEYLYDFAAAPGTRQEAQINAWATAVDTLQLFEDEYVFGREVPWAFEGSRLRILPQAMYDANAFYSRQTKALHFGYFADRKNRPIKTSLSHDIVAHETSHAILDGLRPSYLESVHPDAAGFHEYVGDAAAMLSLFRQRDFLRQLVMLNVAQRSFFNLVTELAPQVGEGLYGQADRAALRSARNTLTYRQVERETDPHVRGQVLSGFAFAVLEGVFQARLNSDLGRERGQGPQALFSALMTAARHTMRMLLRPIDLLPPGNITFVEYVSVVLAVDRRFFPGDGLGYRKIVERAAKTRGLHPSQHDYEYEMESELPANNKLRERDIAMIRSSRVGAYRFLDANRKNFRIPGNRDFRVVGVGTNRRALGQGERAVPETIVQYLWEERVSLPHDVKSTALDHIVLRAGGTVAIDEFVNLVHWSPQMPTTVRKDALKEHAIRLLKDRAIDLAPVPGLVTARPFVARKDEAGGLRMMLNTARMHRGRALLRAPGAAAGQT
jgi:hypothetical protein